MQPMEAQGEQEESEEDSDAEDWEYADAFDAVEDLPQGNSGLVISLGEGQHHYVEF